MIEVGDKVKIVPGTKYYHQAPDQVGLVMNVTNDQWALVIFETCKRHYPMTDLIKFPPEDIKPKPKNLNRRIIDLISSCNSVE
jgi:hypothetical protein